MEPTVVGGVNAFILTPKEIPPANRNRLLVHVHGGGYVYNPGEAGTGEATVMAAVQLQPIRARNERGPSLKSRASSTSISEMADRAHSASKTCYGR